MTLIGVMGKSTFGIGLGIIAASALQLGADLIRYGNVNFTSQFPYPWGPPLGSALMLGVGVSIAGLMLLMIRPLMRPSA